MPSRRLAHFSLPTPQVWFVAVSLVLMLALLPQHSAMAWGSGLTGSGQVATESRGVGDFQAVRLSASMKLVLRQGPLQPLQLQADDNLLPLIETVVESSRHGPALVLRWKPGTRISGRSTVVINAVVPTLRSVALDGSGDVQIESFNTPELQLAVAGSGDVRLKALRADELGVRISGSGDVQGDGSAKRMKLSIAGSGDIRLEALQAEEVKLSIAGSGDAAVNAQKQLEVSIAGSGDVRYVGSPTVKQSIAGSGSVRPR